jgi:hypothetical protein
MKRTKKPFRGSACTGSPTSVAELRATPSIAATIFEKPVPAARSSCLTGGKLEENLHFSLRRD